MTTFADRLDSLRNPPAQSDFSLSKELGVSNSLLRKYLRGASPGLDNLVKIARAKKVHVEWLAIGEGPRDIQSEGDLSLAEKSKDPRLDGMAYSETTSGHHAEMVLIPRLNIDASAGQGIVPAEEAAEEFLALKAEFLRHLGVNPRNAHLLQIRGGSMYPTFRDGDVVIIDASLIEVLEEGFYTIVYGGAVFAKRIQPLRDDSLRIVSDNKADGYIDEVVPASERHSLKIVGRIRGVYRNL